MGESEDKMTLDTEVGSEDAILIPKGTYHNVINIGQEDLKIYSIYVPPHHDHGVVYETQAIAIAVEEAKEHGH